MNTTKKSATPKNHELEKPEVAATSSLLLASLHEKKHAYEQIAEEAEGLEGALLAHYNLEPAYACGVVQTAVQRCAPLAEKLDRLVEFKQGLLQRLPVLALAVRHAQSKVDSTGQPVDELPKLLTAITPKRMFLQLGLELLASAGYFDEKLVGTFRGPAGYREVVDVCGAMIEVYLSRWDDIVNRVPVTLAQIDELKTTADQMSQALGARERAATELALWIGRRQRVATMLVRDYAELQAGVAFLRRKQGDCEQFAPSIYQSARRSGGESKKGEGAPVTPPAEDTKPAIPPVPTGKAPAEGSTKK